MSSLKNRLYALITLILVSHIPLLFSYVFQCRSVASNWTLERPGCISKDAEAAILTVQGGETTRFDELQNLTKLPIVFSLLIDLTFIMFPVALLRNADLRRGAKITLYLLMGLGAVIAIVCIVRTVLSWQVKADDLSWVATSSTLTRVVEVDLGIILACAPSIKPFIHYMRANLFTKDHSWLLLGGKRNPPPQHIRWHSGFRISPPAPTRRQGPRQPRKLPSAAYKMSYHVEERFDPPSIVLPIQRWDPEITSFYNADSPQWKDIKMSGSYKSRTDDLWTLDNSLERHMKAAVEGNGM